MAGIYCSEIYCDDCTNDIKDRIEQELWFDRERSILPDGTNTSKFDDLEDLKAHLNGMDEINYDSDEYPKYCNDNEESDSPHHCGSHGDYLNPTILSDGSKVGYCFGNALTSEGIETIKEMVLDGGLVAELWREVYDYIDYDDLRTSCGDCAELDDNDECSNWADKIS